VSAALTGGLMVRRRNAEDREQDKDQSTLLCPACGRIHEGHERFCSKCGMPLVHSLGEVDEQHGPDDPRTAARKVKPQYAEGELVKVVGARNQTEAEFIQGLLLEEGVPSMTRRSRGFDVPDFLASGPRDVLVPESGVVVARDVLLQSELLSQRGAPTPSSVDAPRRVIAWLLLGLLALFIIASILARL
jgi:hypothetical protein